MTDAPNKANEFAFIEDLLAPLTRDEPGAFALTDDAAVLSVDPGRKVVVTMDTLVADVHFPPEEDPVVLAGRVLGVNLSDLAAMGAAPTHYFLSAALPMELRASQDWRGRFVEGLSHFQTRWGVTLAGGDTVSTAGPLTLTVTAVGEVEKGKELRRSGAGLGDLVVVSGTIGDAALGLLAHEGSLPMLATGDLEFLLGRYREPRPRLKLGPLLSGVAGAAMDVSDGLVADLGHICRESGLGAEVESERLPLSEAARSAIAADPELMERALAGGDDYELLFTVPPEREAALAQLAEVGAVPLTVIGRMTEGKGVRVLDGDGADITPLLGGFAHF